jgi:poly-gamma-glutamate capsule biosynthesis protein CapA/YwtB (metallophosphatase superfamily)
LVAYSLGNFVFDNKEAEQRCSAILRVTLGKKGIIGWNAVPCVIYRGVPHRSGWLDSLGILGRLGRKP